MNVGVGMVDTVAFRRLWQLLLCRASIYSVVAYKKEANDSKFQTDQRSQIAPIFKNVGLSHLLSLESVQKIEQLRRPVFPTSLQTSDLVQQKLLIARWIKHLGLEAFLSITLLQGCLLVNLREHILKHHQKAGELVQLQRRVHRLGEQLGHDASGHQIYSKAVLLIAQHHLIDF